MDLTAGVGVTGMGVPAGAEEMGVWVSSGAGMGVSAAALPVGRESLETAGVDCFPQAEKRNKNIKADVRSFFKILSPIVYCLQ